MLNQNEKKSDRLKDPTRILSKISKKRDSAVCTSLAQAFLPKVIRDRVNQSIDSLMLTIYWRVIGCLWKMSVMLFTGAICGVGVGIGLGGLIGIIIESGFEFRFDGLTALYAFYYAYNGAWIGAISVSILFGIGTAVSEMRKEKGVAEKESGKWQAVGEPQLQTGPEEAKAPDYYPAFFAFILLLVAGLGCMAGGLIIIVYIGAMCSFGLLATNRIQYGYYLVTKMLLTHDTLIGTLTGILFVLLGFILIYKSIRCLKVLVKGRANAQ